MLCLSTGQGRDTSVLAWGGGTAWRDSQSHPPDFGTLQSESRLRRYHTEQNAIQKERFNTNTAEKLHLGEGQKRGEEDGGKKCFLNRGDKAGRR